MKERVSFDRIKDAFRERGVELLTTEDEFVSTVKTKLRYICPKHGEQTIRWGNFTKGAGCRKCADDENRIRFKKDFNEIVEFFKDKPFKLISGPEDYTGTFDYCLECECEKHGRFKMCWNNARRGDGCPKCKMSSGERKIAEILQKNGHAFESEKMFDTCRTEKNRKCRFDFYVDDRYIIEYDGRQHYEDIPNVYKNMTYEERQKVDLRKSIWALDNKIPIIRIPYT